MARKRHSTVEAHESRYLSLPIREFGGRKRARTSRSHSPGDMDMEESDTQGILALDSYKKSKADGTFLASPSYFEHFGSESGLYSMDNSALQSTTTSPAPMSDVDMMDAPDDGTKLYDCCFGMIICNVFGTQVRKSKIQRRSAKLHLGGELGIVCSLEGEFLGFLAGKVGLALDRLLSYHVRDVHLDASTTKAQGGGGREAHIIVYGQACNQYIIGDFLGKEGVFLQHPEHHDESVPYQNPQYLLRPGEVLKIPGDYSVSTDAPEIRIPMSKLVDSVLEVFEGAGTLEGFPPVNINTRLTTILKPHQEKALAFMVGKEGFTGGSRPETQGWSSTTSQPSPAETTETAPSTGGLLADSMGLGKTLVALCLVATSTIESLPEGATELTRASRATLIIAPLSTLSSWQNQIQRHFQQDTFQVCVYHGPQRSRDARYLLSHDIVLTTYDTVASESRARKTKGTLSTIGWYRIILDEAHLIKDRSTARFKAVAGLNSEHRWCLTGTPIQNRIEDFGALLSFLRVPELCDPGTFKKTISAPLLKQDPTAVIRLRKLVNAVTLRRTKEHVLSELSLPRRNDHVEDVQFSKSERELYDMAKGEAKGLLTSESGRYRTILQCILRLRQICNHGAELLPPKLRSKLQKAHAGLHNGEYHDLTDDRCESCREHIADDELNKSNIRQFCPHILCMRCSSGSGTKGRGKKTKDNSGCPLCNPTVGDSEPTGTRLKGSDTQKLRPTNYEPSSKVVALLKNICSGPEDAKSVVFSSWTSMLDLVEVALESQNIHFHRFDGSMTLSEREKNLTEFRSNPESKVLLASIQSAGVGIDLTVASKAHILEPLWNPLIEEQAMDRIHRMGQTKEVDTYRYIVKDSIEARVTNLQNRKLRLVAMSFGGTSKDEEDYFKTWEGLLD